VQNPHDKIERSFLKIIGWTVAVILVLSVGGVFGYRSFRAWQQRRLVAQGNALINEGDMKRASLNARRIIQINPENAEAYRMLARMAEKAGSPTAVDWRRHLMDMGAATSEDLIMLARDAVKFEDKPTADVAMSKLPAEAHDRADYHALMADLAYARRDGVEMERQLSEAARLDPKNKDYQVRLAALRLGANNYDISESGRQTLVALQKDPATRRDATRHLAEDALRRKDFETAVRLARDLDSLPEKSLADRLVLLSALKGANDPDYPRLLDETERSSTEETEATAAVINWMNANGMAHDAIGWSAKLPAAALNVRLVAIALADSFVIARDWAGLQKLVKSGNWTNVDFLRSALAARASREMGNEADFNARWAEAVKKVGGNTRQVLVLADTIEKWNWRAEAIELLWVAAKDPQKGDEALETLYSYFTKQSDTQNLYRVMLRKNERHPDDPNIKNNLAQLSLLVNLNVDRGRELARDVYTLDPHNPAYVSTYAFSVYSNGDAKKASQIIETLTEDQRRKPEIAAYYGIILAAIGDRERAAEFLELGERGTLLPEEKTLVERAKRAIVPD
jgi:cytochrome c-type biogenesis protein CcmH/NrfG